MFGERSRGGNFCACRRTCLDAAYSANKLDTQFLKQDNEIANSNSDIVMSDLERGISKFEFVIKRFEMGISGFEFAMSKTDRGI